jgi:hypothetical protein
MNVKVGIRPLKEQKQRERERERSEVRSLEANLPRTNEELKCKSLRGKEKKLIHRMMVFKAALDLTCFLHAPYAGLKLQFLPR